MTYIKNTSPISILKNNSSCLMQDDQNFFENRTKALGFGNPSSAHFLSGFCCVSIAIKADSDTTVPVASYSLKPSITSNLRIGGSSINSNASTTQSVCALYSPVNRLSSIKANINDTGDIVQAGKFAICHLVCRSSL